MDETSQSPSEWVAEHIEYLRSLYLGKWIAIPKESPYWVIASADTVVAVIRMVPPSDPIPHLHRVSEPC